MLSITFLSSSFRTSFGPFSSAALCSAVRVMPIRCERARRSPEAALFTSCFTEASSLVTTVRLPFSLITTFSRNVFNKTVAKLTVPLGRPFGLPDSPFLKRECIGGFRYPTVCSPAGVALPLCARMRKPSLCFLWVCRRQEAAAAIAMTRQCRTVASEWRPAAARAGIPPRQMGCWSCAAAPSVPLSRDHAYFLDRAGHSRPCSVTRVAVPAGAGIPPASNAIGAPSPSKLAFPAWCGRPVHLERDRSYAHHSISFANAKEKFWRIERSTALVL